MVSHNAPEQGIDPLEVKGTFYKRIGAAAGNIKLKAFGLESPHHIQCRLRDLCTQYFRNIFQNYGGLSLYQGT